MCRKAAGGEGPPQIVTVHPQQTKKYYRGHQNHISYSRDDHDSAVAHGLSKLLLYNI